MLILSDHKLDLLRFSTLTNLIHIFYNLNSLWTLTLALLQFAIELLSTSLFLLYGGHHHNSFCTLHRAYIQGLWLQSTIISIQVLRLWVGNKDLITIFSICSHRSSMHILILWGFHIYNLFFIIQFDSLWS